MKLQILMNTGQVNIRTAEPKDIPAITRIYNEYILHSTATFETEVLTEDEMLRRMRSIVPGYPYLVAEADERRAAVAGEWGAVGVDERGR